jgi:hypothetical protein
MCFQNFLFLNAYAPGIKNDFPYNMPDKLLHLNIFLNAYAPGSIIGHFRGDHRPRLFGGDGMQGSPSVAS